MACMKMNAVAMNIGCSTRTVWQPFQATERKINHIVDVHASQRMAETAIFREPTCTIISKLPQLTPMVHIRVHIRTVYLPKLCVITSVKRHSAKTSLDSGNGAQAKINRQIPSMRQQCQAVLYASINLEFW